MFDVDPAAIELDDLPATLREMAALIGVPATIRIVEHFGGVRLYIPKQAAPDHLIARLVGFENMVRLCQHFGGLFQGMDIPRALGALQAVRRREIRRLVALGKTHAEVARQLRVTERLVRRVVKDMPIESAQMDLLEGR